MAVSQTLNAARFSIGDALPTPVLSATAVPVVLSIGSPAAVTTNTIGGTVALISCTADCHIAWGAAPTATTDSMVLPKGVWTLAFSDDVKISVLKIAGGSDGKAGIIVPLGA